MRWGVLLCAALMLWGCEAQKKPPTPEMTRRRPPVKRPEPEPEPPAPEPDPNEIDEASLVSEEERAEIKRKAAAEITDENADAVADAIAAELAK